MTKRGYSAFMPKLPALGKLTIRATRLNTLIAERGYRAIEAHPTSTRKALSMPTKDRTKIQMILNSIGLGKDLEVRTQSPPEIDAVVAALKAYLHLQAKQNRG